MNENEKLNPAKMSKLQENCQKIETEFPRHLLSVATGDMVVHNGASDGSTEHALREAHTGQDRQAC